MPLSLDQFAHHLSTSGLLAVDEVAALRGGSRATDAEQFARELVKQQKLTAYQAQQVYSGRGKSLVLGNYVVLDKLGQGGMGMVLKAQHRRMNRLVALKVLSPAITKTPEVVARFHREVQAAARLEHPNIVAAYDADEANGTHFFVMQFVEGQDLSAIVKAKGVLPVEQAVNCILQAARGLEFAHRQGVIHRDIKPANLLLDSKGVVKILDMGLARIEGDTGVQAELTNTGAVMGTIDYMAPEQALNTKSADARSDIYSLGISLWYLLVGRPAFSGESLMARMLAHRESAIPSIREALASSGRASPQLLNGLDTVFQRMVAKRSADRYQSMTEVIAALESCLRGETAEAPSVAAPSSEDSKFREFLDGLQNTDLSIAAAKKSKSRSKTATITEQDSEPTLSVAASDANTDPHSFLSRPARRRKQPPKRAWWQDHRVQIGGGLAAVALLVGVIVITITNKDGSKTTVAVPASSAQSVEVIQDGRSVVKVEKTSPPGSKPPPPVVAFGENSASMNDGWIDLFNGTATSRWQSLGPFRVENQLLTAASQGLAITKDEYADFELEFDWKIAEGGNGGVYYRNPLSFLNSHAVPGLEYQLLDNARHPNGSNPLTTAASLYSLVAPSADVTRPLGEFNTSRIVAQGPLVAHWLNGTKVLTYNSSRLDFLAMVRTKPIGARFSGSEPLRGPIALQGHTGTVAFRKIRIRELSSGPEAAASAAISLFNGRDLTGWSRAANAFTVQEGVIVASGERADLVTLRQFGDFEFEMEFRLSDKANSGLGLRYSGQDRPRLTGLEVQLVDGPNTYEDNPLQRCGGLMELVAPQFQPFRRWPEWNRLQVRHEGAQVTVRLNGITTVSADSERLVAANPNHVGLKRRSGYLCLITTQGRAEFRDLQIREISSTASTAIPTDAQVFEGHAYKYFPERLSWKEAKARCEALGGHLIFMKNAAENAFVAQLIEQQGGTDSWMGLTDEAKEGRWLWVNGQSLRWTNWFSGNPNNKGNAEHYGLMSKELGSLKINWQWVDQPNESAQHKPGYVCEWDSPPK
ncbi:MAG TPA: family 16 glycoside hydrolase [Planctomycetaceae bacterium]|nr:family 16 glycoside hydrolase [Planctomycetaceae bacterium]